MAGHSQFKNIMHRKNAQDAKRAKRFTKLLREVSVAVRFGGTDPNTNARLRLALLNARALNVPKENLERALNKDGKHDHEETVCYEALSAQGAALFIEALSNNRNRTAADVRHILSHHGAKLTDIAYLFQQKGYFVYQDICPDNLLQAALLLGAQDFEEKQDGQCFVYCAREDFNIFYETFEKKFFPPVQAGLGWFSHQPHVLGAEDWKGFCTLTEALKDHDDVQKVWTNALQAETALTEVNP